MPLSLSTRWNASRHTSGEAMIEEILEMGFDQVELGYDLTLDLVPGVTRMVREKAVSVSSVHNFCPFPVCAQYPHPELFVFTSKDRRTVESAIRHTTRTIEFAAEVGAGFVVVHAGYVDMRNMTGKLISLCEKGRQYDPRYEKIKLGLMMKRDKKARGHVDVLMGALEKMLPVLRGHGARLAIECLPAWESVPCETEMEEIFRHFNSPEICYWHDMGHAQVRQNLGFISHRRWLERLHPSLGGMHIHDVAPPARDHLMPPDGNIDFPAFEVFAGPNVALVLEPAPAISKDDVKRGAQVIKEAWKL